MREPLKAVITNTRRRGRKVILTLKKDRIFLLIQREWIEDNKAWRWCIDCGNGTSLLLVGDGYGYWRVFLDCANLKREWCNIEFTEKEKV